MKLRKRQPEWRAELNDCGLKVGLTIAGSGYLLDREAAFGMGLQLIMLANGGLTQDLDHSKRRGTGAEEALRSIEWVQMHDGVCSMEWRCPACLSSREDGHEDRCTVRRALAGS